MDATMPGTNTLKSGAARVLATTTTGIFCNVFVMDPLNDPPTELMPLLVTGQKKQKGQSPLGSGSGPPPGSRPLRAQAVDRSNSARRPR
jgi:hypothetical protein